MKIFRLATQVPRLVRWGRSSVNPLYHVCSLSRAVAEEENILIKRPLHRNKTLGFYVHPDRDVIYHKTRIPTAAALALESSAYKVLFNLPLDASHKIIVLLAEKQAASAAHEAHRKNGLPYLESKILPFSIQHKLQVYQNPVARLAIPIDDAFCLANKDPADIDNLFTKLNMLFPQLEELICFLWPTIYDGDSLEELEEVTFPDPSGVREGRLSFKQVDLMQGVVTPRQNLLNAGDEELNIPKLTFMRKVYKSKKSMKADKGKGVSGGKIVKKDLKGKGKARA